MAAAHPDGDPKRGRVTSKLAELLRTADTGRRQTRVIIPTLAVQLALVVLVVLGLVLAVGLDQRRAEIGLARLRGQSRQAAARLFLAEIAALVLAAVLPGFLLAWLGCALLARWWLPAGTPVELRWPVLAAGLAVAAVELLLAVGLARRTAGQPIGQLLRGVQRSAPRFGAAEAALAVAALAGVTVSLTGDRTSAVALVTPSAIAILAGLVLSRLLLLISRRAGRRALWRGRLTRALAAFEVARRPGIRRVVTLVCVAVALLVSAVDEQSVSAANRAGRAEASVGAPVVLDVGTQSAARLRSAVAAADPAGNYAMPVITQRPDGGDTPVVAVDPPAAGRDRPMGIGPGHPQPAAARPAGAGRCAGPDPADRQPAAAADRRLLGPHRRPGLVRPAAAGLAHAAAATAERRLHHRHPAGGRSGRRVDQHRAARWLRPRLHADPDRGGAGGR